MSILEPQILKCVVLRGSVARIIGIENSLNHNIKIVCSPAVSFLEAFFIGTSQLCFRYINFEGFSVENQGFISHRDKKLF